jgi:outer membrane protein OmpA-like peptidoglycan-associated protein
MKSLALAAFLVFCLGPLCPLSGGRAGSAVDPALQSGKNAEDPVIPADAQEKAILALKALGADRGAKAISFKTANILGVSKGVGFDSKQVQKTLKDLEAKETKTTIQIDLPGDVLFDFDKWDIRPDAEGTLKKVGEVIKAYRSSNVLISGHSDSKGQEDYNQKLSLKRAEAVKDWLVKNAGVDAGILRTEGLGETKPVAPNTNPDGSDNPDGRQKNRRVEILIKKQ